MKSDGKKSIDNTTLTLPKGVLIEFNNIVDRIRYQRKFTKKEYTQVDAFKEMIENWKNSTIGGMK